MELTSVSFENYKAFPRRETLEIRPLTVLIGRNSSGKSAVARLPLLLSRALSEKAEAPVELDIDGVDFGSSFVDLIHNRRVHGAIGLGASFRDADGSRVELWAKVQHFSELMLQVVSFFECKKDDRLLLRGVWEGSDPQVEPAHYRWEWGPAGTVSSSASFAFKGLLPSTVPLEAPNEIIGLISEAAAAFLPRVDGMRDALARTGYLGPFREEPKRQYRFPGGLPQHVGLSGVRAPELLGADFLRRKGVVLKAVSDWYEEYLGNWRLDINRQGETFAVILKSPDDPDVEINLVDVGAGLSQVLPLVVQRKFEALTGTGGGIEVIEQPELHLHPAAHGPLADLYIEAAQQSGARFLIETHSENFVLRIRRRIAEGFPASLVSLYWVDDTQRPGSRLLPIEILPNGDVATWPRGVFAEDFEEVKAIRLAAREHDRA